MSQVSYIKHPQHRQSTYLRARARALSLHVYIHMHTYMYKFLHFISSAEAAPSVYVCVCVCACVCVCVCRLTRPFRWQCQVYRVYVLTYTTDFGNKGFCTMAASAAAHGFRLVLYSSIVFCIIGIHM